MGYFIEGRRNKKFDTVDRKTLQTAYESQVGGKLNIWVDPNEKTGSTSKESGKEKQATKGKKRERRK